jgi:hypothetical protein
MLLLIDGTAVGTDVVANKVGVVVGVVDGTVVGTDVVANRWHCRWHGCCC